MRAQEGSYYRNLKAMYASKDPAIMAEVRAANEALLRVKATPGNVHTDQALTNLSVKYENSAYIGLKLMPFLPTGGNLSGIFYKYDKRTRFAYPDDEIGARGSPNELNHAYTTDTYSLKGYGYKEYVDNLTIKNQTAPLNEMADLQNNLAEAIAFRRELRIATVLTTAGNYSGNTTAIAAGSAWNSAGGGDPIGDIQTARAGLWNGSGNTKLVGFTTLAVFNVLSRHPNILDLFKYGGTAPGLATAEMLGKFFGLDELWIAESRKDTANEGQTASYSRIWSDVFGIVRVANTPSIRSASFGYTFHSDPFVEQWYDPSVGTIGGWYGRQSVLEDHKVVAGDTGWLLTGPLV